MDDRNLPPHRLDDDRGLQGPLRENPQGSPSLSPSSAGWAGEEEGGLDFRRYLAGAWRRKWVIVLCGVMGVGVGVGAFLLTEPEYSATTTLWIETPQGGSNDNPAPIRLGELLYQGSWIDLLTSFAVLDPVVLRLALYITPFVPGDSLVFQGVEVEGGVQSGRYRLRVSDDGQRVALEAGRLNRLVEDFPVGASVGEPIGLRWTPPAEELWAGRVVPFRLQTPRDAARTLRDDLDILSTTEVAFVRLGLHGNDPLRLANGVNAVSEQFVQIAADLKRARLDELTRILTEQVEWAQAELEEAEFTLQNFKVQTISLPSERATPLAPGLEQTNDPVFTNFFNLKLEQEELRRDEIAIQRALARVESEGQVPSQTLELIGRVRDSGDMAQALTLAVQKRADLRALQLRYTDDHPAVQELMEDLRSLERSAIPDLLRTILEELQGHQAEIAALVGDASEELRQIPPRVIEEARLERQADAAESLFRDLQQRSEAARLAAASTIADVRILDRAFPPQAPTSDSRPRLFLMASLAGLAVGLAGALLLDRLDPTVRYPDQVTRDLGLPILGTIPHLRITKGQVDPESQEQVVEAFRDLRLSVSHAHGGPGCKVVTITSPVPEDGKSFTSSNLGLAFAEMGRSVLLVDGDVRKGTLHDIFALERKPGLTDLLAGQASREKVVRPTGHPKLSVLPCGSRFRDGPELLSGDEMRLLLRKLRAEYDFILIDSPPLGATVDPFVLGTLAGAIMVVVRNGQTDRSIAMGRLDSLERLPVQVLGAVLNDVPRSSVYQDYSYLPGYGETNEGSSREPRLVEAAR